MTPARSERRKEAGAGGGSGRSRRTATASTSLPAYGQQVGDEGRAVHLHHLLLLRREAGVGPRLVGVGVLVERAPRVARVRDEAAALVEPHRRERREPRGVRVVLLRRAVGEQPLAAPQPQPQLRAAGHPLLCHRPDGAVLARLAVNHARREVLQRAAAHAPHPLAVAPHPARPQQRGVDVLVHLLVVQELDTHARRAAAVGRARVGRRVGGGRRLFLGGGLPALGLLGLFGDLSHLGDLGDFGLLVLVALLLLGEQGHRHRHALPPAVVVPKLQRLADAEALCLGEGARREGRRLGAHDGARLPLAQRHALALLERAVLEVQLARLAAARGDDLALVPRADVALVGGADLDGVARRVARHVLVLGQRRERRDEARAAVAAEAPRAILLPEQHSEELLLPRRRGHRLVDRRGRRALGGVHRLRAGDGHLVDELRGLAVVPEREERGGARAGAARRARPAARRDAVILEHDGRSQLRGVGLHRQLALHALHEEAGRLALRHGQQLLLHENSQPAVGPRQLEHLVGAHGREPILGRRRRRRPQLGQHAPLLGAVGLGLLVEGGGVLQPAPTFVHLAAHLRHHRRAPPAGRRLRHLDATALGDLLWRREGRRLGRRRLGRARLGEVRARARARVRATGDGRG
eukprot:scaffold9825_cov48-Phaeocystis_antarctica.AAC.2